MKLETSCGPHITKNWSTTSITWWLIVGLLPATIASVYYFKGNAFWIIVLSVSSAILTDALIQKVTKKRITIENGSVVAIGLLLALTLPPNVPWWIPVLGSAFAIAIGKRTFGFGRSHIFNPALVGRAFLVASWPKIMTEWITPDGITAATPLAIMREQGMSGIVKFFGSQAVMYRELFIGNVAGTIGETSALALLLGAALLFYKGILDWKISSTYLGSFALLVAILGEDVLFHLLSGGLLLGALFMATDYVTTPITKKGKILFGLGCGLLTVIFRMWSNMTEGVMFSILIMNSLTPLIDRHTMPKPLGYRKNERNN